MFNEIQFTNLMSLNVIEFFNNQILSQAIHHAAIHKRLKEEGNKLKIYERELERKIRTLTQASKKRDTEYAGEISEITTEIRPNEPHIVDLPKELDNLFKDMSFNMSNLRYTIKKSFDDYIESLCSFAQTKNKMRHFQTKSEDAYKDSSPIMEKKFELLMNLKCSQETKKQLDTPSEYLDRSQNFLQRTERNSQNMVFIHEENENSYLKKNTFTDNSTAHLTNTFYTPSKNNRISNPFKNVSPNRIDYQIMLPLRSSQKEDTTLKEQRSKLNDYYNNNNKRKHSRNMSMINSTESNKINLN